MASGSVIFNVKSKFIMNLGLTYFDVLYPTLKFQKQENSKVMVCPISIESFGNHSRNPILREFKNKIEEEYGVIVRQVVVLYFPHGESEIPYHQDNYGHKGEGVFSISIGSTRMFLTKNIKTSEIQKYMLEDGDLMFFNKYFDEEYTHSTPAIKGLKNSKMSVLMFV